MLALRAAVRIGTGHSPAGFDSDGRSLIRHDTLLPGGGCAACELLAEIQTALHPPQPGDDAEPDEEQRAVWVRRGGPHPGLHALGGRD